MGTAKCNWKFSVLGTKETLYSATATVSRKTQSVMTKVSRPLTSVAPTGKSMMNPTFPPGSKSLG